MAWAMETLVLACTLGGWRLAQRFPAWRHDALWWGCVALSVILSLWSWHWASRQTAGWLVWSGQQWRLEWPACTAEVSEASLQRDEGACAVLLDFQHMALVRWRAASTTSRPAVRYLWLSASQAPAHWHALRSALYGWRPVVEDSSDPGEHP